jgi:hypothetical protein
MSGYLADSITLAQLRDQIDNLIKEHGDIPVIASEKFLNEYGPDPDNWQDIFLKLEGIEVIELYEFTSLSTRGYQTKPVKGSNPIKFAAIKI